MYCLLMVGNNLLHHRIVQALQADLDQYIAIVCCKCKITRTKKMTLFQSLPLTMDVPALNITSHQHHQAAVTVVRAETGILGCAAAKWLQ